MKSAKTEKYLGDMISCDGLAESVTATVNKRKGNIINSIIENKAVIEDCRANTVGGLVLAIEI